MLDRQLTHLIKVQRANRSRRSSVEAMVRGYHVHAYRINWPCCSHQRIAIYAKGKLAAESMKSSWRVKSLRNRLHHRVWGTCTLQKQWCRHCIGTFFWTCVCSIVVLLQIGRLLPRIGRFLLNKWKAFSKERWVRTHICFSNAVQLCLRVFQSWVLCLLELFCDSKAAQ